MAKFESRENELYIDGKKVLRAWESWSGWYWFATEKAGDQNRIKQALLEFIKVN